MTILTLKTITEDFAPTDNIFFIDPENNTLLIDFQSVKDKIEMVKVYQKNNRGLLFNEEVHRLPSHTIYEIPADMFSPGVYNIELHTTLGLKYSQEINIKTSLKNTFSFD